MTNPLDSIQTAFDQALDAYLNGRLAEAIESLSKVPDSNRDLPSRELLGRCFVEAELLTEAENHYRKWLELEQRAAIATYMLSVLAPENKLSKADPMFVESLNDLWAEQFETFAASRNYQVPQLIDMLWQETTPTRDNLIVADLGCGVGLCGDKLKPAARLVGVDLSEKMLDLARRRNVYDDYVQTDFVEFLREQPNAFDVIVAGDCLDSFGDLSEFFELALRALKPDGRILMTVEEGPLTDTTFHLLANGRFIHSPPYIIELLGSLGIEGGTMRRVELRIEKNRPVRGLLLAVQKPDL